MKRFEARWLHEKEFSDTVLEAWNKVGADPNAQNIHSKLSQMHSLFHDWDQRVLKKPKKRLKKAQRELEKIMMGPINDETEVKRKELAELVEYLLEIEEIHHLQRSRATWLKNGDRNTGFFQAFASARRKKNMIKKLKDGNGDLVEGTADLNSHIQNYFANLFTNEVQQVNHEIIDKVQTKVSVQMNNMLLAPFTADDGKKAVFSRT